MRDFVVPRKELLVLVYFGSSDWDASSPPPKINILDIPYTQTFRFSLLGVQVLQVIRRPDNPPAGQCQPLHSPARLS